jgi:dihydroorotate dehydrogenase electron transfer subunit
MKTSLPQVARVVDIVDESPQVRTMAFDLRIEAEPGQFVMAWLPGVDEKPFSLVRADPVTLTIARVGPFTGSIHTLRPGDQLWLRGPLGNPFTLPTGRGSRIILIAGGYGVAPLHFLAERAQAAGHQVSTVIGARTAPDVVFAGRFASLGVPVTVTTDDGSLGQRGVATDAAASMMDSNDYHHLYACGPEAMLEAVERLARARRLPAQLSYEQYMRCGFGVCGSCAREGWLVCSDGPVKNVARSA